MAKPPTSEGESIEPSDLDRFYEEEPELKGTIKTVLTQYSGIPEEELVAHLKYVRGKAWAVYKYPCIGRWSFLNLSIALSPQYADVLERLQAGQTLLDLGCCFGQDVRKLVFDGAPAENLTGTELEQAFIDLGHELFRDHQKLQSRFVAGDFFELGEDQLKKGSFDMVHAASFFHLFSWNEQVQAMSKTVSLLKQQPGSMIFGRQTGSEETGVVKFEAFRLGEAYRHNPHSWRKLVDEVGQHTGVKLSTDVAVAEWEGWVQQGQEVKLYRFCVTIV